MTWKQQLVKKLNRFGYDLRRYRTDTHSLARRMRQMQFYQIDLVIDVGANVGQFGEEIRNGGYVEDIYSFEPLEDAFAKLKAATTNDNRWKLRNCALGAERGRSIIHVAGNSYSSSLLNMLPSHEEAAPHSRYVGEQEIIVETLDHLLPGIAPSDKSIWLKIDTQGFEHQVIAGAVESLCRIGTVQMEVSLTPLYEGALGVEAMISLMGSHGYGIVDVDPGFCDRTTGRLLQVDMTFHRD
jgi:FkbM family methyltransferase